MRKAIWTAAMAWALGMTGTALAQQSTDPLQQPLTGSYQLQQPLTGSYQLQQPLTGSYQLQQPLTGSYQLQQPLTGSYQLQQPMTGSYNLDSSFMNNSSSLQPLNNYVLQPPSSALQMQLENYSLQPTPMGASSTQLPGQ